MKEIILSYLFAFIITIISSYIYTLLGGKDIASFVNHYLIYILLIYYLTTIFYLYKKHKKKETKLLLKNYFPYITLGISIATTYNMIVYKFNLPIFNDQTPQILLILSTGIIGPIFEEMLFRYIFYNRLKKKYPITKAIIINSIIFGLIHINPINIIYAIILGILIK